jgi:hypothetical protein
MKRFCQAGLFAVLAASSCALAQEIVVQLDTLRPRGVCFLTPASAPVTLCEIAANSSSVVVWNVESRDFETVVGDACATNLEPGRVFWLRAGEGGSYTGLYPTVAQVRVVLEPGKHLVAYPYPVATHWTNLGIIRDDLQNSSILFFPSDGGAYHGHNRTRSGWQPEPTPDEILQPGEAFWYITTQTQTWIEARPY